MNSHWITSSLEDNGMFSVQEGPAAILRGGGCWWDSLEKYKNRLLRTDYRSINDGNFDGS